MIAKMVKGRGFRGALEYNLGRDKGRLIDSNMVGESPRELAAEFGQIRKLRPKLGKAVLHVSLSAAPGEKLTDGQWSEIGQRYLRGMGFKDNQFLITRHTDTEHEHVHILANRITHGGEVVSDSRDYQRQEALMREIERDYGLQRLAPSAQAVRRAPTQGEIEQGLRTGQPSARQQLQQLCDAAARSCRSFTDYQERLEAAGVELVPVVQLGGAKLSGLSYRLDGVQMKGSDLGRGYTAAGLQKKGITYEQDRDLAAVRRSIERQAHRATGQPDGEPAPGQAPERGEPGRGAGAPGAGDGRADRGDAPDAGRDRAPQPGAGRGVQEPDRGVGQELPGVGGRGQRSRAQPEPGRAAHGVAALPAGRGDGPAYGGARDRVVALAGAAAQGAKHAEPAGGGRAAEARRDRSLEALQRQVAALGAVLVEVGVRDARTGQMINREWTRAELEQSAAWLKRMNARGSDIYIRPAGVHHGLVLLDDLKADALQRLSADGFAPAALIESSPGNYQAWVKLTDRTLSAEVRRIAARELAQSYGADPNSADGQHYGRLAGFTNQKPRHTRDGRQPYVLAHGCAGRVAEAAPALLQRIAQDLDRAAARQERQNRLEALQEPQTAYGAGNPLHEYKKQAQRLLARFGEGADLSRMDWMIATDMAKSGRFTVQDIERGIRECSPHIDSRKAGHIEDYAKRTAEKAWMAPEVQAHRQEQARQQERAQAQARSPAKRDRGGPSLGR